MTAESASRSHGTGREAPSDSCPYSPSGKTGALQSGLGRTFRAARRNILKQVSLRTGTKEALKLFQSALFSSEEQDMDVIKQANIGRGLICPDGTCEGCDKLWKNWIDDPGFVKRPSGSVKGEKSTSQIWPASARCSARRRIGSGTLAKLSSAPPASVVSDSGFFSSSPPINTQPVGGPWPLFSMSSYCMRSPSTASCLTKDPVSRRPTCSDDVSFPARTMMPPSSFPPMTSQQTYSGAGTTSSLPGIAVATQPCWGPVSVSRS
mmetsp:Transcript_45360/g.122102  ORF Transcript_45360/g.122102 Transcript_45360/m.122102 type:complete len:264 (-) Transcript_45360:1168-1959(-)